MVLFNQLFACAILCAAVVATVGGVASAAECQSTALEAGSKLREMESCVPAGPFASAMRELTDVLELNLDEDNVVSIALFGTKQSGMYRAADILMKAVDASKSGTLVATVSLADNADSDGQEVLHRELFNTFSHIDRLAPCARAGVVLQHLEAVQSAPVLNLLLGVIDRSRPHVKGVAALDPDASTAQALVLLMIDMEEETGVDWSAEGWNWREWLDAKWSGLGKAYTPGTLTGRLTGAVVMPTLSEADEATWQELATTEACGGQVKPTHLRTHHSFSTTGMIATAVAGIGLVYALKLRAHQLHHPVTAPRDGGAAGAQGGKGGNGRQQQPAGGRRAAQRQAAAAPTHQYNTRSHDKQQ